MKRKKHGIKKSCQDLNKHWFSIYVGYTLHYLCFCGFGMWFMHVEREQKKKEWTKKNSQVSNTRICKWLGKMFI